MDIPVTLIVKAPNQQFEDQTIKCELSWTIKRLKSYLSLHYPSQPSSDEQKLIYSGQLLNDAVVLKDILRQYDDKQIHTVHLVFTSKTTKYSPPKPQQLPVRTNETETNGLRHRNVSTTQQTINTPSETTQQQITSNPNLVQNIPAGVSSTSSTSSSLPYPIQSNDMVAHQIAMHNWMQQAYSQYLNQYMNSLSMGVPPQGVYMPQQPNNMEQMYYPPQINANTVINSAPIIAPPMPANQLVQPDGQQQPQDQPQQPGGEVQPQAQPRFPNVNHEEVQENRDWLDMFYAMSRLMILLTLVYFYSSPLRCLFVLVMGVSIYLYHIGFFRTNQPQPAVNNPAAVVAPINNNNIIENNNNPAQAAPVAEVAVAQQPDENVIADENQAGGVVTTDEVTADETTTRTSVMALIRTFVLSFFTSLIPEAPAL